MDELNDLLSDLKQDQIQDKPVEFPLDFYPERERNLMIRLHDAKGLSLQHMGVGMLPVFARIYNRYRAIAFNGAFQVMPIFWVSIVDQPGSNKSEALKAWYNPLSKHNSFEDEDISLWAINDTTPEGLIHNMKDQEDGCYLFYDEITSFIGGIGQYKKNADFDKGFWLSLFTGQGVSQLRVQGGIRNMGDIAFSVGGTTQPKTLAKIFKDGDMDNGFFDRFLWSVERNTFPKLQRNPDYDVNKDVEECIDAHVFYPKYVDNVMKFTTSAKDYLFDWYETEIDKCQASDLKAQFFGKHIIYVNRFAMLTNILYANGETPDISLDSAQRAVKMYQFFNSMQWRAMDIISVDRDSFAFDVPGVIKFLVAERPDINKTKLAEALNMERTKLYRLLE